MIQAARFGASRTTVLESIFHILLALKTNGAIFGGFSGSFVTSQLGCEFDLVLAFGSESEVVFFDHFENILAESISGWLVPVAGSDIADGEVNLLSRSFGCAVLPLPVGNVLYVTRIHGHANGRSKFVDGSIGMRGYQTSRHQSIVTALQILENVQNQRAETGGDRAVGDHFRFSRIPGLVGSRFVDPIVLGRLGGLLVEVGSVDRFGFGAWRIITDDVLAAVEIQGGESKVGNVVDVPFGHPLIPGVLVTTEQLAFLMNLTLMPMK